MPDHNRRVRYEVRLPLEGAADPAGDGATVSRHRTLDGAARGLRSHQRACSAHGGYSQAVIYDTIDGIVVSAEGATDEG